jgi:ribonuclease PH
MNIVQTGDGRFIEIQGTAETQPFDNAVLQRLLDLAADGVQSLVALQKSVLGDLAFRR